MTKKQVGGIIAVLTLALAAGIFLHSCCGMSKAQEHLICALGDSITYGAGVKKRENTWTAMLGDLLGDDWEVLNYGQNGATLQAEGDRPYESYGLLEDALKQRAGIYLFMLGANDSKSENWDEERFYTQLRQMVNKLCRGNWKHQVILMKLPWAFEEESGTGQIRGGVRIDIITEIINPMIEEVADEYGLRCIDLYALTENHPDYYKDGLHPNKKGNRVIAEYILKELQQDYS